MMETTCTAFDYFSLYRRSGILVLVNDTDWEVLEKENTPVEVHYHFLYNL